MYNLTIDLYVQIYCDNLGCGYMEVGTIHITGTFKQLPGNLPTM